MSKYFTAIVKKENEWYIAECPEIGTVSQGITIEESVKNLKEATELYLEEFPCDITVPPLVTIFETNDVKIA